MKSQQKRLLIIINIIFLSFFITKLYGQSDLPQISILQNNKWILVIEKKEFYSEETYTDREMTHTFIDKNIEKFIEKRPYYLSDNIDEFFQHNKIGRINNGKYIITAGKIKNVQTQKIDDKVYTYQILKLDTDSLIIKSTLNNSVTRYKGFQKNFYDNGSVIPIGFTGFTDYTSVLKAKVGDNLTKPTSYSINFELSEKTEIRVRYELSYKPNSSFKIYRSSIKSSDGKIYTLINNKMIDNSLSSSIVTLEPGTYTFMSDMEVRNIGMNIELLTKNILTPPTSYKNVTYNGGTQLANFDEDSPTDFESFAYCEVSDQLSEPTAYTINFRVNREKSEIMVNYELSDNENNSFRIYGISIKGNGTTYNLDSTKIGANEYESKESITLPPGDYSITTKMAASGVGVHINLSGKYAQ